MLQWKGKCLMNPSDEGERKAAYTDRKCELMHTQCPANQLETWWNMGKGGAPHRQKWAYEAAKESQSHLERRETVEQQHLGQVGCLKPLQLGRVAMDV